MIIIRIWFFAVFSMLIVVCSCFTYNDGKNEALDNTANQNEIDDIQEIVSAIMTNPHEKNLDLDTLRAFYSDETIRRACNEVIEHEEGGYRYEATYLLFQMRDDPEQRISSTFEWLEQHGYEVGSGWLGAAFRHGNSREYAQILVEYTNSTNQLVKQEAFRALFGFADDPEYKPSVLASAQDPNPEVRRAFLQNLADEIHFNRSLAEDEDYFHAVIALTNDISSSVRVEALETLGSYCPTAEITDLFRDSLEDSNSSIRGTALIELTHILSQQDMLPLMIDAIEDESEFMRGLAIDLLRDIEAPLEYALPPIIERLNDPDRSVRYMAISYLERVGPSAQAALPMLSELVISDDEAEAAAASRAIDAIEGVN